MNTDARRTKAIALVCRIAIGALLVTCIALPAAAYGETWGNAAPFGVTHFQPTNGVRVDLWNTTLASSVRPTMVVNGVTVYATQSKTSGHWVGTESFDTTAGIWKVFWTWVTDAANPKYTITGYPSTNMTDGVKPVTVTVRNTSGVTLTYSWSFVIGIPPVIGTPTPANHATFTTLLPTVSVPVSDNTGVTSWDARFNGTPAVATLVGGVLQITPAAPLTNDTDVNLTLTVYDAAGNSASKAWAYYVQTIAPMAGGYTECTSCHFGYDNSGHGGSPCTFCHSATGGNGVPHTGEPVALHLRAPLDQACRGCHVSALLSQHNRNGRTCLTCHASTDPLVKAAIKASDSRCIACHPVADHASLHVVSRADVCANCHVGTSLTVIHPTCAGCHESTDPLVVGAIANGLH